MQVLLDIEKYGKLPVEGGLFDQPDILMMLLKVCDTARNDVELVEQSQKQAEEAKHGVSKNGSQR